MRSAWIFGLVLTGAAVAAPRFAVESVALDASSPPLAGPFIALVWKSDCGPCLRELGYLGALQAASGGRLLTLALDAPDLARATLSERDVAPHAAYAAAGDARAVLTALSGGDAKLPLSVAVNASGEICASHAGMLGTDQARDWAATCWK